MLKVIQVKIQEYTSYKKKSSETVWFDRSRDKLHNSPSCIILLNEWLSDQNCAKIIPTMKIVRTKGFLPSG